LRGKSFMVPKRESLRIQRRLLKRQSGFLEIEFEASQQSFLEYPEYE